MSMTEGLGHGARYLKNGIGCLALRQVIKEASCKARFPNYEPTCKEPSVSKELERGISNCGKVMSSAQRSVAESLRMYGLHISVRHDGEKIVADVLAGTVVIRAALHRIDADGTDTHIYSSSSHLDYTMSTATWIGRYMSW